MLVSVHCAGGMATWIGGVMVVEEIKQKQEENEKEGYLLMAEHDEAPRVLPGERMILIGGILAVTASASSITMSKMYIAISALPVMMAISL